MMARCIDCPKCGVEIPAENYQSDDPSVGIFGSTWICDNCGEIVVDDDDGSEWDI